MKVTCKKDNKRFKLYIEELLHLDIPTDSYIGMQSWLDDRGTYSFVIEFYFKDSKPIFCEYEDRKLWESILILVDKNL